MTTAPPKKRKYKTGFCNSFNKAPQCEGTKPVSADGTPMPTCADWQGCACSCHEMITKMYADIGMNREPPDQSHEYLEWVRAQEREFDHRGTWLDGEYVPLSNIDDVPLPIDDENTPTDPPATATAPSPAHLHAVDQPSFAATPTGRRARGQLEYDVLKVCQEYAKNVYDWTMCTPKLVAERIGKMNETEPPSTGAINSVWDRWEKLEFALQDKKPSRFVRFVGAGDELELQRRKSQTKREKKRVRAEVKRGSLRPRGR